MGESIKTKQSRNAVQAKCEKRKNKQKAKFFRFRGEIIEVAIFQL